MAKLTYIKGYGPARDCAKRWGAIVCRVSSPERTAWDVQNDMIKRAEQGKYRDGHVEVRNG